MSIVQREINLTISKGAPAQVNGLSDPPLTRIETFRVPNWHTSLLSYIIHQKFAFIYWPASANFFLSFAFDKIKWSDVHLKKKKKSSLSHVEFSNIKPFRPKKINK